MKVILLEDVKALGKKGQVVEVSDGYAKNFILKKKLGLEATGANMNDLKLQKARDEKVAQQQLDAAKEQAALLEEKSVTLSIKAGEGGKAFGSVSSKEIADAPARSYCRAISRYGKSTAISPLDGDAFLTSQITEIPGAASAFSNGNPVSAARLFASFFRTSIGFFFLFSSTRARAASARVSRIVFSFMLSTHFCARFLRMSSLCQVRADTNPAIEKFFQSSYS